MARGRLSQAYLFVGPDGIGKQQFARRLAQCLLCQSPGQDQIEACGECAGCRPFLASAHPDFLFVGLPEGKRELPIAAIAGSDERRGQEGLCHDLSIRPLAGSRKVALINDADTMTEPCANAFLKSLEEPPERAVLFLIASNLDAVLPTIRSRCQLVRFAPLSAADIAALLVEQDLVPSREEAHFAATLSAGSLTVAKQLLEPELRSLRSTLYLALSQPNFSGLSLSKILMEGIDKISSDTPAQRVNIHWLIRFAIEFYRAAVWRLSGGGSTATIPEANTFADRIAPHPEAFEILGAIIDRTVSAASHLDQNISVALTLDALLDDVARLARTAVAARPSN